MAQDKDHLKDKLVAEAYRLIEEKGVDQISFREIARRLGVSHQAPYKHFASKDHILAAVIARSYEIFAGYLEGREKFDDPYQDLRQMGVRYLDFANRHPLHYRLMFNTALPSRDDHPVMMEKAEYAFSLLHVRIKTMRVKGIGPAGSDTSLHDAMFIWSALHGYASLMQSDVVDAMSISKKVRDEMLGTLFARIGLAFRE